MLFLSVFIEKSHPKDSFAQGENAKHDIFPSNCFFVSFIPAAVSLLDGFKYKLIKKRM
jgi:hypothetical protein